MTHNSERAQVVAQVIAAVMANVWSEAGVVKLDVTNAKKAVAAALAAPATPATGTANDDAERVARAIYAAQHLAGPFGDEPVEWGRGGYKTQVGTWEAAARAAIAAMPHRTFEDGIEAAAEVARSGLWGPFDIPDNLKEAQERIATAIRALANGESNNDK